MDGGLDMAVQRVKEMQRTDAKGKVQWIAYCGEVGDGRRDPKAHTEEFINSFFDAYEAGTIEVPDYVDMDGGPSPSRYEMFVGGLPSSVSEDMIRDYFNGWGMVRRVDFKPDRGFCFVTFDNEATVEAVLENTDHELDGKWIECKKAEDRRPKPASGGNDYGYSKGGYDNGGSHKGGKGKGKGYDGGFGGKGGKGKGGGYGGDKGKGAAGYGGGKGKGGGYDGGKGKGKSKGGYGGGGYDGGKGKGGGYGGGKGKGGGFGGKGRPAPY
eukprot:GEMP01047915.1.p1 GENE.GEMP01047915.1~~GEMP01047915.1.p1  ORF type:complete len:297 (+),score=62.18 GEMP01047915.1:90-893(+)